MYVAKIMQIYNINMTYCKCCAGFFIITDEKNSAFIVISHAITTSQSPKSERLT